MRNCFLLLSACFLNEWIQPARAQYAATSFPLNQVHGIAWLEVLALQRFSYWHDRKFGVQALGKEGRIDEALAYAEASRGLNQPDTVIDAACERILLDAGRERFQARYKAAENREKRLKQMLVWFMISRNTPKLRGSLNTISLQANSAPSLTIQETTHIPDSFYRAKVELTWVATKISRDDDQLALR